MFPCIQPTKIHILFDMYTITLKKNITPSLEPDCPTPATSQTHRSAHRPPLGLPTTGLHTLLNPINPINPTATTTYS